MAHVRLLSRALGSGTRLGLCLCMGLALAAQTQAQQQAQNQAQAFQSLERTSTRYPDQVDSDQASGEDPVWVLDVRVQAEAKPEAWRKIRTAASRALREAELELQENLDASPRGYVLAFHPKNARALAAMLDEIEFLGDRDIGRLGYGLRDCQFTLEGTTFDFTPKGCWVKLRLRNRPMGRIIHADGEPRHGADGALDPRFFASRKLATRLRALLDKGPQP